MNGTCKCLGLGDKEPKTQTFILFFDPSNLYNTQLLFFSNLDVKRL